MRTISVLNFGVCAQDILFLVWFWRETFKSVGRGYERGVLDVEIVKTCRVVEKALCRIAGRFIGLSHYL